MFAFVKTFLINADEAPTQTALDSTQPSRQPWMNTDCFIKAPTDGYGYRHDKECVTCTKDELISKFRLDGPEKIKLVWTPQSPRLVVCEEVDFLRDTIVSFGKENASRSFIVPTLFIALFVVLAIGVVVTKNWDVLLFIIFMGCITGLFPLIHAYNNLRKWNSYPAVPDERIIAEARYWVWVGERPRTWQWLLPASITIIGVLQIFVGLNGSVRAAGIAKEEIWQGELWRLMTGTLLHANGWHWTSNMQAVLFFSILIEVLTRRFYVVLVFLIAAFGGSLFSLWGTQATSIGASGGIMGMLGFLLYFGYLNYHYLPKAYISQLGQGVFYTALMGLIGYKFIDNWAHLGGFITGVVLGFILLPQSNKTIPLEKISINFITELISLCVLLLLTVFTITKLL